MANPCPDIIGFCHYISSYETVFDLIAADKRIIIYVARQTLGKRGFVHIDQT